MPRIRSIKPEFWSSGQVLECSRNGRLLFIGLWNFCDDSGRHRWRPRQVKAEVFPGDEDITAADVEEWMKELEGLGLLMRYEVKGEEYLEVTGWHHQKINKPQPAKFPAPADTTQVAVTEHSGNGHGTVTPDRIGKDRIGREEEWPSDSATAPMSFPLASGEEWPLPAPKLAEWIDTYPRVDVPLELGKARQWLRDNPSRRKTARGMTKCLGGWLSRADEKPAPSTPSVGSAPAWAFE